MRIAVLQSCYVPWRGFFDLIASVDKFILYDDVQYSKGSWRNRNRLKMADGLRWITVPVSYQFGQPISSVQISQCTISWVGEHLDLLHRALGGAPYLPDVLELWREVFDREFTHLSELNAAWIRVLCRYLEVQTQVDWSSNYALEGKGTDRLMSLLRQVGATSYLSGPSADAYLDKAQFQDQRIRLLYKRYIYPPYPQLWGAFVPAVSLLDLIANCGPAAREFIRSTEPDEIIVP